MLVVLGLRAVGVHRTTDDALEWSPPEVEESALERQQPGTHDHESGLRYNYVQAERKVGGASGAHGLPAEFADLFGVGGGDAIEVQVAGTSAMKEIIEKLFSQSGQVPPSAAMGVRGQAPAPGASTGVGGGLRPPPVAPLPPVKPGASLADVLREIKKSLRERAPPPGGGVGLDDGGGGGDDEERDGWIDELSPTGLARLEVELARRIRRVRAARLRHVAVGQAGDVGTSAGATPDGVATGLAQAAAAPTPMMDNAGGDGSDGGNGGGMALASNVLASVLQGHGRRGGRPAGGVAPTASLVRAQGHVVGAAAHSDGESGGESEDDTLAGYASRLAAEAHGRIGRSATAARSDSDEQDEDSESVAIDAPMKEMLQKLFGGADGEVVEVKIVVGGEGDVVGGRGGGSATGAIDGLVEHFARVAAEAGTDDDDSS